MAASGKHLKTSQRLSKRRALEAKVRQAGRWALKRTALFALIIGLAGGWWYQRTGRWDAMLDRTGAAWDEAVLYSSERLGLVVSNVYLEGRERMPLEEAQLALGITEGDPILSIKVDTLKARLEETSWVHTAQVKRALPDTLHIHIEERQPLALWQWQGKLQLIDQEGMVITKDDIASYSHLPVVVGHNAPDYAYNLLMVLSEEPELFARVSAAVRVGDRRWNIRFYDGTEIMLPEDEPSDAWRALAGLEKEKSLLSREVTHIDMRTPGRVYIRLSPGAVARQQQAKVT